MSRKKTERYPELLEHLPGLRKSAQALVRSTHQAEELVQHAILKVIERWDEIDRSVNLGGYLYTCLRHAYLASLKDSKKYDELDERYEVPHMWKPPSPYMVVLCKELVGKIAELPSELRQVMKLAMYGDGMGDIAIASDLDMATVADLLWRARRHLGTDGDIV